MKDDFEQGITSKKLLLEVKQIGKREKGQFILQDISLTQNVSQRIGIAGETGSGKTTLMRIIAGLIQADAGDVFFKGNRISGPLEKLMPGHPDIAYLSQQFELPNNYWVGEVLNYENKLTTDQATALFDVCRITHLFKRKTSELSGGEKQRIAMARLLISAPKLLLLDEPFSNLDPINKSVLKAALRDIGDQLKIDCILVSHDPQDTLSWSDHLHVMKDGKIIQSGSPEEVYHHPLNEYVAGLFGPFTILTSSLAALFKNNSSIDLNNRSPFFRPEDFIITNDTNGVPASITDISFLGNGYQVEVEVNNIRILIRCSSIPARRGDMIYLCIV